MGTVTKSGTNAIESPPGIAWTNPSGCVAVGGLAALFTPALDYGFGSSMSLGVYGFDWSLVPDASSITALKVHVLTRTDNLLAYNDPTGIMCPKIMAVWGEDYGYGFANSVSELTRIESLALAVYSFSLDCPTVAQLKSGKFWAGLQAYQQGYPAVLYVDHIYVEVTYACSTPIIVTTSLPSGEVSGPYSQTLQKSGGSGGTWSVVSGSLPAGLILNAQTGIISGTPTAGGVSNFTVRYSISCDGTKYDDQALSITIIATATKTSTDHLSSTHEGQTKTAVTNSFKLDSNTKGFVLSSNGGWSQVDPLAVLSMKWSNIHRGLLMGREINGFICKTPSAVGGVYRSIAGKTAMAKVRTGFFDFSKVDEAPDMDARLSQSVKMLRQYYADILMSNPVKLTVFSEADPTGKEFFLSPLGLHYKCLHAAFNTSDAVPYVYEILFREVFDNVTRFNNEWTNYSGAGVASLVTDPDVGQCLSFDNLITAIHNTRIPYDPTQLYRIRHKFKRVSGSGTYSAGFAGRNAADTQWENTSGADLTSSQHYIAGTGFTDAAWKEFIGYVKGEAATGEATLHFSHWDPGKMHQDADLVSPHFIANSSAVGDTRICLFEVTKVNPVHVSRVQTKFNWDVFVSGGYFAVSSGVNFYLEWDQYNDVESDFNAAIAVILTSGGTEYLSIAQGYAAYDTDGNGWWSPQDAKTWKTRRFLLGGDCIGKYVSGIIIVSAMPEDEDQNVYFRNVRIWRDDQPITYPVLSEDQELLVSDYFTGGQKVLELSWKDFYAAVQKSLSYALRGKYYSFQIENIDNGSFKLMQHRVRVRPRNER